MEKVIKDAGGCKYFVATITYPDNEIQIPSRYHYEYILNVDKVADDFDNVNHDEVNSDTVYEETNDTYKIPEQTITNDYILLYKRLPIDE